MLPSTNAVIAQNLFHLSSLFEDESFASLGKSTVDAFAVEILQHPFLFVGMLSALIMLQVGLRNVVQVQPSGSAAGEQLQASEVWAKLKSKNITRDGKTLVSLVRQSSASETDWIVSRNPLLAGLIKGDIDGSAATDGGRERILVCEAGSCRELRDGESLKEKDVDVHG